MRAVEQRGENDFHLWLRMLVAPGLASCFLLGLGASCGVWGFSIAFSGALFSLAVAALQTLRARAERRAAEAALRSMAAGDLRGRAPLGSSREIGAVCHQVNELIERMQAALVGVSESASHVSAAANSLKGSAEGLASGVEGAANQVNAIATAGEEMSATSAGIAQNCTKAAKSSEEANLAAAAGEAVIRETLGAVERIGEMVTTAAQSIRALEERSDRIGQVVALINDVADQTSLLALNAAIEAARAGENGRGFAVVADEVRKLAERTTRATREIGETILHVQKETREAVATMERGVKEVELGAAGAQKSSESLHEILAQVQAVSSEVAHIAVASEQQRSTSEEIARSIQSVSGVMRQTSESIQKDAGDVAELAKLARELRKLVSEFHVFTASDAEAMVEAAVAYAKANGKAAALREIQDPRGKFTKGELFVYAQDVRGTVLAHPANSALVGQNHLDLADAQGKLFVRELVQVAERSEGGWVDYHFMNPATQRVQPKTTFCRRVDDYIVACGIYS